jgi:prevent-host-death family protein
MQTKTIGIREMKAHLSGYLKDVKKGEEFLISERGKAIARIVPIGAPAEEGKLHSALVKLALAGAIILPSSYKPPRLPKFRKKVKGSLFSKAVIEDRR